MLLSEVCTEVRCQIVRDGPFDTVGFLSDPQPSMFVFLESRQFLASLRRTPQAVCAVVRPEYVSELDFLPGLCVAADPRLAFHRIHEYLALHTDFYWSDFDTEVHPEARIAPTAAIAAKNVRIGPRTIVEPNAVVLERCTIGANVVIRSGAVLGSVGFQSTPNKGRLDEMPHAGGLIVEDGVHILANSVVATAVFRQSTRIGTDARIGACAFISHNVQIGPRAFIGHGAVVNGNVTMGHSVWIGPSSSIANGIQIGDEAEVALGSVVIADIESGKHVAGNFAVGHRTHLRHVASLR